MKANDIPFSNEKFTELFENKGDLSQNTFDFFKCFTEYIDKGKLTKTPNTIKGQTHAKLSGRKVQQDFSHRIFRCLSF